MRETKRPLKVFLCHAHADSTAVRVLYNHLIRDGVDAWLDKEKLIGGQDWEYEIRQAVRESDVVVVCLSKQFAQKGFRQYEVRIALEEANLQPEGEIFIIPLRLEDCNVPQSLRRWHWVDLFEEDGYERLMRALRARSDRIGATLQVKRSWLPRITSPRSLQQKPVETKKLEGHKKQNVEAKDEIPPDDGLPRIDEPLPPPEKFPESWKSEWQPSFESETTKREEDLKPSTTEDEREAAEKAARGRTKRNAAEKSVQYPFARLKGMQEFMEFMREPDWKPGLIDVSLLKRLGMAKGKEGSVIQALRFLGVVDDAGIPTNEFDNLKRDYQATLKRLVQEKYSDLLSLIPLSKTNQIRLVSYFGDPVDTAEYQAKLFVWFCEQSGIELPRSEIETEEEKLALEKAAQEKLQRETAEKVRREEAERKTAEKAMQEKAKRDEAERARRERAKRRAAQMATLEETFSKNFNALRLAIPKAMPFLRIGGIIGIIIVLFWVGSWTMPQLLTSVPTAEASVTSQPNATNASSNSPVPFTKTVEPTTMPTITLTPASMELPAEITDSKAVQMVLVPEGEFTMGSDTGPDDERPTHTVYLDAYYIDKYEVTNGLYKACVNAGVCHGEFVGSVAAPDYFENTEYKDYPVRGISWHEANNFCSWRGTRLPTEAEWEKAARGVSNNDLSLVQNLGCESANRGGCAGRIVTVGSYEKGKSIYGVYDLIGNVSEWVADYYSSIYYYESPVINPQGPSGPTFGWDEYYENAYYRVVRGGSWYSSPSFSSPTRRAQKLDAFGALDTGFRCAKKANP